MLTVIGCGNPIRSDDGVGCHVAGVLLRRFGAASNGAFQVFDAGTDGMGVMFRARGSSGLILVDACRSDAEPGTIYAVPGDMLAEVPAAGLNLHEFRWNHALHAGRQIFGAAFPSDVTVYLIESVRLDHGLGLSPAVERAASEVAGRIADRLQALAGAEPADATERAAELVLSRGMLQVRRGVYDRYFPGLSTVVLLRRGFDLLVMPVHHAASGGYMMKIRNAEGDRVIDAADFFRAYGLDGPGERRLTARWRRDDAALAVADLFCALPAL
ncbi:MAG TPA: hydrogenase maturation protease [Dongiaceae bacterium]|nr:hydrogenase maturation protease [Dongiaceae bacterium]